LTAARLVIDFASNCHHSRGDTWVSARRLEIHFDVFGTVTVAKKRRREQGDIDNLRNHLRGE
jgi:hypothetical protein